MKKIHINLDRTLTIKTLILIFLLLISFNSVWAESTFSILGPGEILYPSDTRGRGMGGVGIAVNQENNLSTINPALGIAPSEVSFIAIYEPESRKVEDSQNNVNFTNSNIPLIRMVIPTLYDLHFDIGVTQFSDSDYNVSTQREVPNTNVEYREKVTGEGGIYTAHFGVSRKIINQLAIGFRFNYYFGDKEDHWIKNFDDPEYIDTNDAISNEFSGNSVSIGLLSQPIEKLHVGLVYTTSPQLTLNQERTHVFDIQKTEEKDVTFPMAYGIGASYTINPNFTVAGDFYQQQWSDFEVNDEKTDEFVNTTRMGIGIEYINNPSVKGSYFSRIPLRLGFYRKNWYYDYPDDETIMENFVTTGFGVPLKQFGMIDFSFEMGKRGDKNTNKMAETIYKFSISISGHEKWGKRERTY